MNFEDFIIPVQPLVTENWQLGSLVYNEIVAGGIVLLFVSDFRGRGGKVEMVDYREERKILYQLSKLDFELPICDLGNLLPGKTPEDSQFVIQEVVATCIAKKALPIIIGGSLEFSYSVFAGVHSQVQEVSCMLISNALSLKNDGEKINEKNFLGKLLSNKEFSIQDFHFLGYQKHLNEEDSVKLIKEVDFDIVRLSEMMNDTDRVEPFFRKTNVANVNCNAIESFASPFSVEPQVNGLNRREICAYMKEIGLSQALKAVGIFNYQAVQTSVLNQQLFAQMIWYLLEGVNIQFGHPKEREYETFLVLIDDFHYTFKRDTFSGLWYFGEDEEVENCIPCSKSDYEDAKRGKLNLRLIKNHK